MEDIMKVIKSLKELVLLMKGTSEAIKYEAKNKTKRRTSQKCY